MVCYKKGDVFVKTANNSDCSSSYSMRFSNALSFPAVAMAVVGYVGAAPVMVRCVTPLENMRSKYWLGLPTCSGAS
jgi:hypothetical protein